MQHLELPQDAYKTQTYNIMHDETLILPIHEYLQLRASQYKQKHNIHHTPYTNIQHNSALQGSKTPLSLTTPATQQTFPQTPTQSLQQT